MINFIQNIVTYFLRIALNVILVFYAQIAIYLKKLFCKILKVSWVTCFLGKLKINYILKNNIFISNQPIYFIKEHYNNLDYIK